MNEKMCVIYSFALCFLTFVYSVNSASAPFITKCKLQDLKCIEASAQRAIPIFAAGIPELGVEKLDPIYIKSVDASTSNMKLIMKDFTGTGLSKCIAKKIQPDTQKSKLFVKLLCSVDFKGQYEIDGKLLIVPIEGKGDAHISLKKIQISVEVNLQEKKGNDGEKHWAPKDWTHSFELKDKATVELANLFNGNEVLGRAARDLIASSSNDIVMEVGPPIVKAVATKVINSIDHFFAKVPLSELVLN